mmetsp:Transcript_20966/g.59830  ORF Transcript_20966/g.59830 Transcript_20966/m.59830 type:complete len:241 (-) Transcript_20966:469-1191(-)
MPTHHHHLLVISANSDTSTWHCPAGGIAALTVSTAQVVTIVQLRIANQHAVLVARVPVLQGAHGRGGDARGDVRGARQKVGALGRANASCDSADLECGFVVLAAARWWSVVLQRRHSGAGAQDLILRRLGVAHVGFLHFWGCVRHEHVELGCHGRSLQLDAVAVHVAVGCRGSSGTRGEQEKNDAGRDAHGEILGRLLLLLLLTMMMMIQLNSTQLNHACMHFDSLLTPYHSKSTYLSQK